MQVVNLLVNPDQAQTLSLASTGANGTKIQLVLRNPLDTDTKDVKENSVGTIFAGTTFGMPAVHPVARRAKPNGPPPSGHISVEVINGSKRTEEKFSTPEAIDRHISRHLRRPAKSEQNGDPATRAEVLRPQATT